MSDHLFVYGTLMRQASGARLGRDMRARLELESDLIDDATIAGRLFDRGRYPLLLPPLGPADVVHGELLRLHEPSAAFLWLDPYEGLEAGKTRGKDYERTIRPVHPAAGGNCDAWVYLWIGNAGKARPVPGGRWTPAAGS